MRLLTERNGGRREEEPSGEVSDVCETGSGAVGIDEAISESGTDAEVPLSNRIWYDGDPEVSGVMGMSMTVPARSILVVVSIRSTRVPGG